MAARGEDGLWHQVMDRPATEENYGESSCTAMFIYGLQAAAQQGLAGEEALRMAKSSMDALWERNVVIAADGYPELTRICNVAGLAESPIAAAAMIITSMRRYAAGIRKGRRPS